MFEEEFAKLPIESPRRMDSLPGLRLRGAIPKWALILPLFFISFFAFIPLSIMNSDPAMRLAMGPTESAQGRVVSNTNAGTCQGGAWHRVTYSFSSASGGQYRGTATLCAESPYYSVKEGDIIAVEFLSSNPTVNSLPGNGRNQAPPLAFFLIMPVFFLVIFGSLFWPQVGNVLRARRLFRNGRLATGQVIFVKKRLTSIWPGMPGSNASDVYIEFKSAGDGKREVVASCQNDWLINQLAPGALVHIAYSDDKTEKVALLDAYLR
ncbi:MAG: hypothetical protein ACLQJ0_21505 [Steroidobacteraceae bacterium]|jgi:hypothetical protein